MSSLSETNKAVELFQPTKQREGLVEWMVFACLLSCVFSGRNITDSKGVLAHEFGMNILQQSRDITIWKLAIMVRLLLQHHALREKPQCNNHT